MCYYWQSAFKGEVRLAQISSSHLYKGSHMKLFATLTAGLLFGLAACQSTPTTAPGAVSGCCGGKSCSTDGACNKDKSKCTTAACKDKMASTSPGAVGETKSGCCADKSAAASPGAVSETKSGCCADKSAAASPGAVSETKKSGCATSCSDKAMATSPGAVSETKSDCSTPCSSKAAATSPGAVSETKSDCKTSSGCPMTGAGSCPFSGKTNG